MPSVIPSTGIGSGIDIRSLVDQLVAAEGKAKVQRFDADEAVIEAQEVSLNTIAVALNNFQSALSKLSLPSTFEKYNATVSDSFYYAASANEAADGYFDINVQQIAESNKVISAAFGSNETIIGQGTLVFTINGIVTSLAISESQQTLTGIAQAINQSSNLLGLSATIVTTDDGSSLVLTSNNTGSDYDINVSVIGDIDGNNTDNSGLSQLCSTYLNQVDPGKDAIITIDSAQLTSSSNTITDAISGVTLNLIAPHPTLTQTSRLTIQPDIVDVTNTIVDFVNAFNDAMSSIKTATQYVGPKQLNQPSPNGPFLGDATMRALEFGLHEILNQAVEDNTVGFQSISELGITTDSFTGLLTIDSMALASALNTNFEAVGNLFTLPDGLANNMSTYLEDYTEYGGLLTVREQGMTHSLERISESRVKLERRLQELESRLTKQFIAMDRVVAKLKNVSDFLKDALKNLPKPGNHHD